MVLREKNIQKRGYTEKEAADYIAMSSSYLRQARAYGCLASQTQAPPFIKIGRAVRYLKDDLDAWLDAQTKAITLAEIKINSNNMTGQGRHE